MKEYVIRIATNEPRAPRFTVLERRERNGQYPFYQPANGTDSEGNPNFTLTHLGSAASWNHAHNPTEDRKAQDKVAVLHVLGVGETLKTAMKNAGVI